MQGYPEDFHLEQLRSTTHASLMQLSGNLISIHGGVVGPQLWQASGDGITLSEFVRSGVHWQHLLPKETTRVSQLLYLCAIDATWISL